MLLDSRRKHLFAHILLVVYPCVLIFILYILTSFCSFLGFGGDDKLTGGFGIDDGVFSFTLWCSVARKHDVGRVEG